MATPVTKFKVEKVNNLPAVKTANTLYVVTIPNSDEVELHFSTNSSTPTTRKARIGALSYTELDDKPVDLLANLTPGMVAITDTTGKIVSHASITATELSYLDNVVSNIQDQLNAKQDLLTGSSSSIADTLLTSGRVVITDTNQKINVSDITVSELNQLDNIDTTKTIQTQINSKQATITGAATTIASNDLTADRVVVSTGGKVAVSTVKSTELDMLTGINTDKSIQSQLNDKQATITGAASTIVDTNLTSSRVIITNENQKVAVSDITVSELNALDGVDTTKTVQTQLNAKQATITGAATTITSTDLTADRVVISTGGKVAVSTVKTVELDTLTGIDDTKTIQTQLNSKQATITGAASTITSNDLSVNMVMVTDSNKKVSVSNKITVDELNTLDEIDTTKTIQAQLNAKVDDDEVTNTATASKLLKLDTNAELPANATSATKLKTARTVSQGTDSVVNFSYTFDGSADVTPVFTYTDGVIKNLHAMVSPTAEGFLKIGTNNAVSTQTLDSILNLSTANVVAVTDTNGKLVASSTITTSELNTLDGIDTTTTIKDLLAGKQATVTGSASSVVDTNLTADRVVVTGSDQKLNVSSNITTAELNTLDGITTTNGSTIQTQLNNKADLDTTTAQLKTSQIPSSILGGMIYKGATNENSLPGAASGNLGHYYVINAAGTNYAVGDWAVSNGTTWDKINNTDKVTAVGGMVGDVTKERLAIDKVNNTADSEKNVLSAGKLTTARTISQGANSVVNFSYTFDGSANVTPVFTFPTGLINNINSLSNPTTAGYLKVNTDKSVTVESVSLTASNVTSTAVGTVAATNVQAAIQELDEDIIASVKNIQIGTSPFPGTFTKLTANTQIARAVFSKEGDVIFLFNNSTTSITISQANVGGVMFYLPGSSTGKSSITLEPKFSISCLVIAMNLSEVSLIVNGLGVS